VLTTFHRIVLVFCIVGAFALPAIALDEASALLTIHRDDGSLQQIRAFPKAVVDLLFPSGDAVLETDARPNSWKVPASSGLKNIEFVKVSDVQRRFDIIGVTHGDRLFMFTKLFCGKNPDVMSLLMKEADLSPKSSAAALALTKLYMSLTFHDLEDPADFTVSSLAGVPKLSKPFSTESPDELHDLMHAPRATATKSGYEVEFFTRIQGKSILYESQLTLGAQGIQNVSVWMVYPDFQLMLDLRKRAAESASRAQRRIEFSPTVMANGFGEGADQIDMQIWAASEGSGLERKHYYFHSHEKAEAYMQAALENAVAKVDIGPWLDAHGEPAGRQTLIILVADNRTIYAEKLYEDQSSVTQYTCSCIQTLTQPDK
jgi:hypothetical protein